MTPEAQVSVLSQNWTSAGSAVNVYAKVWIGLLKMSTDIPDLQTSGAGVLLDVN